MTELLQHESCRCARWAVLVYGANLFAQVATAQEPAGITMAADAPPQAAYLHNVFEVEAGLLNGSAPLDEAGFDALAAMGVRTIVCVDGMVPDVENAAARGMRYVHLPIGYDGVKPQTGRRLAKAIRDLPRPMYVHCSHGIHRSPAAEAFAMVALGRKTPEQAVQMMRNAGTSPRYEGLFEAVRAMKPYDPAVIDETPDDFPAREQVTSLIGGMARIGRAWDRIKLIRQAGWRTPADHPDVQLHVEATIIADLLADLAEAKVDHGDATEFAAIMRAGELASRSLIDISRADVPSVDRMQAAHDAIATQCDACHAQFRN